MRLSDEDSRKTSTIASTEAHRRLRSFSPQGAALRMRRVGFGVAFPAQPVPERAEGMLRHYKKMFRNEQVHAFAAVPPLEISARFFCQLKTASRTRSIVFTA